MKTLLVAAILFVPMLLGSTSCSARERPQGRVLAVSARSGWLGVRAEDMSRSLAQSMNVKTETGAYVREVMEGTPAENAGVKDDDIVVEFNGQTINDADDLVDAVRKTSPGTSVSIVVMRNDEKKTLQVTVGKLRARDRFVFVPPVIPRTHFSRGSAIEGMSLQELNKQLAAYFEAPNGKGVLVEEVEKGSPSEKAGFRAGDVIVRVGKEQVEDIQDIWDALEDRDKGDTVGVNVIRKGNPVTLTMEIGKSRHDLFFKFRSDRWPGGFDLEELQDMKSPSEIRIETDKLKQELQDLGRELKSVGKEIRDRMQEMRDNLRKELKSVTS